MDARPCQRIRESAKHFLATFARTSTDGRAGARPRAGNLTNDLVWALKWDGENRLIEATNVANVPNAGKQKLTFAYDHLGRRVRKTVYPWGGSNYSTTPSADLVFVYDGWNLLAELNATNKTVLRSHTWGLDLSGDSGT